MTDLKISKKSHPSRFLAWRILLVSILLLAIPLFIQDLLLYRQEYAEKLEDVTANLQDVARERAFSIQQKITTDWADLEAALQMGNVKPLYMQRIPLPRGATGRFILPSKSRNALVVGKEESATTALIMLIPYSEITQHLSSAYTTRIALLDAQGKILTASAPLNTQNVLTVKIPLQDTSLTLEVAVDEDRIEALHLQNYYMRIAIFIILVGVIGGGIVYFLTRRIAKPLTQLWETMERISDGKLCARYTPDWMGFEFNQLGKQFNQMMDNHLKNMQEVERQRVAREKLAEELRIGHDIQANLLPKHVPGFPDVDLAAMSLSAKEVNGDYYDLFRLENGKLLIAMCDISGKGISACLYCVGIRGIIRSFASMTDDLAEIVQKTNDLFWVDAHEASMFATLWIGIYDPSTQRLTYCTQGHPPGLLHRSNAIQELQTGGIAVGAQQLDTIAIKTVQLQAKDLVVLYTDGIIEAHNSNAQLFGKKQLKEFLLKKSWTSAKQLTDQLLEEIHLFVQGTPQHDDMALIVLRITS